MSLEFDTKVVTVNGALHKILLQNENGPCALVALCNVLLLSPYHAQQAEALIRLVQKSDTISLNDLVTVLANVGVQNPSGANADVNQLLQLLPQLHTGLNINPMFNGSFQDGVEMSLFRLFNVSIVHGWLVDYNQNPVQYEHLSKYSYDEAQRVLVQAYDIKQGNLQCENQEDILADSNLIKSFLARTATQLTEYGLNHLKELIIENSFAVLFRNDHFATIYKNNGELFLLVTDLGFKNRKDIVWQSLKSVNGSQDTFYTGDFFPVSLQKTGTQATAASSNANPFLDPVEASRSFDTNSHQQNNEFLADEELARRLQEEEDARVARNLQRNYNATQKQKAGRETAKAKERKKNHSGGRKRDKLKKNCIIM